jgi:hypothetical protein
MRIGVFVLGWCLFTATVPAALAQQPASAGANRPNLRVLQALPEAQLFLLRTNYVAAVGQVDAGARGNDTVTRTFLQIRRNVPVDDALFRLTSPRQSTCDCC